MAGITIQLTLILFVLMSISDNLSKIAKEIKNLKKDKGEKIL